MAMTVTDGRGVLPILSSDEEFPSEPLAGLWDTSNKVSRFTAVLLTPLRSANRSRCRWVEEGNKLLACWVAHSAVQLLGGEQLRV